MEKYEAIELAKNYLRGEDIETEKEFLELHDTLIKLEQFSYACEIVLKKNEQDKENGIEPSLSTYQKLVMSIYKDTGLSSYFKFDKAIKILEAEADLATTTDSSTLAIAGSIFKRKWQFDSQYQNLILARSYCKKGYDQWLKDIANTNFIDHHNGYSGINYAFVCELCCLENIEQYVAKTGITSSILKNYDEAKKVRIEILNHYFDDYKANPALPKKTPENKWVFATFAEAYFGLKMYDHALHFIELFLQNSSLDDWEIRSFSQQILNIAYMQIYLRNQFKGKLKDNNFNIDIINIDKINACFKALDIENESASNDNTLEFYKDGKLGLALSGGGFRASLFHIGVLAGLAEKNQLKNIEIISCVSGGSIIGAYYYLKLKELLELKTDAEILQSDYIQLVQEIETDFLNAVQKNIRVQLFTNPIANIKMLFKENYSRSHRLGELYEKYFYAPLFKNSKNTEIQKLFQDNDKKIFMHNLMIRPKSIENESGIKKGFDLKKENWKRNNKIPQLILNATTVNTGHNWQFTASWMGEPPTYISDEFDVKPRFRRMYYKDAPNEYKKFRLGYAVAASSCVPVLFQPLILKGIYPKIDLELIDGGLHDNQGIASILEQECKNVIISDASGQLAEDYSSTKNELSLFMRTDNILQERVRELQFFDIKSKKYSSSLNNLITLHLKKDLAQLPVSWVDCTDVNRRILNQPNIEDPNELLDYGVMKKIQKLLSEVRTDLDSFNDLESYALMYSGYQQIIHEKFGNSKIEKGAWKFMHVEPQCTMPDQEKKLIEQLKVSNAIPFKVVKMSKFLRYFLITCGIIGLFVATSYLLKNWNDSETIKISYKFIGTTFFIILIGFLSKILAKIINIESIIKQKAFLLFLITAGCLLSNLYLLIFNPFYNKMGKIK
jgi:predicted acylesterase/phospholipase RssA